jgi:hypothetical protein
MIIDEHISKHATMNPFLAYFISLKLAPLAETNANINKKAFNSLISICMDAIIDMTIEKK